MTPIEAKTELVNLKCRLDEATSALAAAKESLDDAAIAAANAIMDAVVSEATILVGAITTASVSAARIRTVIRAAATELPPAKLKAIAEANRVSSSVDGIILPAGKFENLSRGKGWCRQGSGSSATWGERVDNGYRVAATGKWTVGSNDGFSRKDSTMWTVTKIGDFWLAN